MLRLIGREHDGILFFGAEVEEVLCLGLGHFAALDSHRFVRVDLAQRRLFLKGGSLAFGLLYVDDFKLDGLRLRVIMLVVGVVAVFRARGARVPN